jgi:hypothetical protein
MTVRNSVTLYYILLNNWGLTGVKLFKSVAFL